MDKNLIVVKEGSKLLTTNRIATIICANIREPDNVLKYPNLSRLINFAEPVRILIICVAYFLIDTELTHIMLLI